ncbi:MAG: ORF6N domain-containing protein [Bacteroidales bacterium]|nr:ORF6N domain-containing protein [Bacteroidales bacterium]
MNNLILTEVEEKIITLRGQKVILDCDLAQLYGVQTKEINQAVRNNPEKFPEGYVFELVEDENSSLRSKILTLKNNGRGAHSKYKPKAFTEKGLYMLATILKSPRAVQATLAIVETFTKLRELTRTLAVIRDTQEQSEQKTLLKRCGDVLDELITNNMPVKSTETSFELNFAMLKLKHTVKREDE